MINADKVILSTRVSCIYGHTYQFYIDFELDDQIVFINFDFDRATESDLTSYIVITFSIFKLSYISFLLNIVKYLLFTYFTELTTIPWCTNTDEK